MTMNSEIPEKIDDYECVHINDSSSDVTQEEYGEEPRSIIMGLLSQVSKGMDLHRIPFPTFVLEPRSLLERITDYMSHPQLILGTPYKEDPLERFVDVVRYYLSGWHIRPKGVKKPYNPVLGEFFRCRWRCDDGSHSFYIAEQVSHHPPITAYFYANPDNHIVAMGNFLPKPKFLGNSIVSVMKGNTRFFFTNIPGEEYIMTNPNIYARGILFGTMIMELGDGITITCEANDLVAEIEFLVKGYFTGSYNAISGKIRNIKSGKILYEISGNWSEKIFINKPEEQPWELFNPFSCPTVPKYLAPLHKQDHFESRHLWNGLTEALSRKNYENANAEKNLVEDEQRALNKIRDDDNIEWRAKFFRRSSIDNFWYFVDRNILKEDTSQLYRTMRDFFHQHYGL